MGWGALKSKLHEHALYAKQKKNHKHVQWRTHHHYDTTDEPVIAKGPEVMPDTVTQRQKTLQRYRPASLILRRSR